MYFQALELLNEFLKYDKSDPEVYSMMAVVTILENDYENAKHLLLEGLKYDIKNYDLLYNLGYVYELLGDQLEALIQYRKALKFNKYEIDSKEISDKIKQISNLLRAKEDNQFAKNISLIENVLFIDFQESLNALEIASMLSEYGVNVDIAYSEFCSIMNRREKSSSFRKVLGVTNLEDLIEYSRLYNYDVIHVFNTPKNVRDFLRYKGLNYIEGDIGVNIIVEKYTKFIHKVDCETDYSIRNELTILIPTYNRPDFLKRTLIHIKNFSLINPVVMVLDSSSEVEKKNNQSVVENVDLENVIYKDYPNDYLADMKLSDALLNHKVDTKYTAVCFDDDFLTEEGLIESLKALDEDSTLFCVKGKNLYFIRDKDELFEYDWFNGLLENTYIERLENITKGSVPNFVFLVFRTEPYVNLQSFYHMNRDKLPKNTTFVEYLYNFLKIMTGKIGKINVDLNIRDQSIPRAQEVENFPHAVVNRSFNENYIAFVAVIKLYADYLGEDRRVIDEKIETIFIAFLVNFLKVPEEYIKIESDTFDLDLLEKGMKLSWVWPKSLM